MLVTVVLVFERREEMVTHARPARKQYLDLLPQRRRRSTLPPTQTRTLARVRVRRTRT